MNEIFERTFKVGWAHVDLNGHLRNTAYIDLAVDVRLMYFEANGFPVSEFGRLGFGPVIGRDEIDYRREVRLMENVTIDLLLDGVAADASRFRLRQDIRRSDGTHAARLISVGGWLSFATRKLIVSPQKVIEIWTGLKRTENFEVLPSSVRD